MTPLIRRLSAGFAGILFACSEGPVALDTGTLEVTSASQGEALDPDGFALTLDGGRARSLGPNDSLTLADLSAGAHTLRLSGLAPNCILTTPNPVTARLPPGGMARVAFEVECSAPGALEVVTATTGPNPEPDGYIVIVDGGARAPLPLDGRVRIADLLAGDHTVQLSGLTANCRVSGANPRSLALRAGETTETIFEVFCGPPAPLPPGQIRVTTRSTGTFSDPNGYTVSLDGGETKRIEINGSVLFTRVTPGVHSVRLGDLAPGCGFFLANPKPVTVTSGASVTVSFAVLCIP
jgi:hypothetical protein